MNQSTHDSDNWCNNGIYTGPNMQAKQPIIMRCFRLIEPDFLPVQLVYSSLGYWGWTIIIWRQDRLKGKQTSEPACQVCSRRLCLRYNPILSTLCYSKLMEFNSCPGNQFLFVSPLVIYPDGPILLFGVIASPGSMSLLTSTKYCYPWSYAEVIVSDSLLPLVENQMQFFFCLSIEKLFQKGDISCKSTLVLT